MLCLRRLIPFIPLLIPHSLQVIPVLQAASEMQPWLNECSQERSAELNSWISANDTAGGHLCCRGRREPLAIKCGGNSALG